jgi:hypothetical protein
MSRTVRTLGVGFLVSAWLLNHSFGNYTAATRIVGFGGNPAIAHLLLCTGAGLFLAGLLWPGVEFGMLDLLRASHRLLLDAVRPRDAGIADRNQAGTRSS